jgi:hypothetical protein
MLIVNLLVNENLVNAESALNKATSGNIIELCRNYILVLNSYRDELSKLRGTPEISFQQSSTLARELTEQVRRAIRGAIEITTRERNMTESLLKSFTAISGYEAVDTLNQMQHKGFDNWELQSSGVRSKRHAGDELMTIQEAVETAGALRREAYVTKKIAFLK